MSRYRHPFKERPIPKRSRTIPIKRHEDYGDSDDRKNWFRCWNCDFVCNLDQNATGGPDELVELGSVPYTQTDQYGNTKSHCEGVAGATQTICEAAGGTWTSTWYKPAEIIRGCPLCGSINYLGDY